MRLISSCFYKIAPSNRILPNKGATIHPKIAPDALFLTTKNAAALRGHRVFALSFIGFRME
jgi:hypothetical protein